MAAGVALWTIGHGTVELDAFVDYVRGSKIECLTDVRRFPSSRRHPQFAAASLESALFTAGIDYAHAVDLGGRRRPLVDSSNGGLRNEGFRGYADWMQSDAFQTAFDALMSSASARRTVVMCAETPWWKCHRRLIADAAMLLRRATVTHLVAGKPFAHVPTQGATVAGNRIAYPDRAEGLGI